MGSRTQDAPPNWPSCRRARMAEAELERRRSRILEDINGNEPLAAILEQITGLVSFNLGMALCWCEVPMARGWAITPRIWTSCALSRKRFRPARGRRLARCLPPLTRKRHPGPRRTKRSHRHAAGHAGHGNPRLDADLRHRSEFDLLTDVHNRFSLERRLKRQIDLARHSAGIFGLIYIDLDRFKQINDLYGHHTGDLYLQAVARALKHQLRPGDLLARLGGDEFRHCCRRCATAPRSRRSPAAEALLQRSVCSGRAHLARHGQLRHRPLPGGQRLRRQPAERRRRGHVFG
jgi:GGDEF domain-containing protein